MKSVDQKPRVLLVDDYGDAREMYAAFLGVLGFETVQAANGVEALRQVQECRPDIVVMDLSLPVMDGWETTCRLRADERTAKIPIVALSGHALADVAPKTNHAGFDSFIVKPCLPEELIAEIRRVLAAEATQD